MPSYLKLKPGVQAPSILVIAAAAINAKNFLLMQTNTVITSANDSEHMAGSLHYRDRALDFRTADMAPRQIEQWADEIRKRLGAGFDVVIERDHIHVEHNL
jgi:conjugal transfer mating pair stabilization protein TraG